jgi:hypothetical protein
MALKQPILLTLKKVNKMETWKDLFKYIKRKSCELVCKLFGITQCLCNHECNCKKEKK